MDVAIIGLGNIGSTLARNLAQGGQPVAIADKTPETARTIAGSIGARATAMPIDEAIAKGDVIILAIPLDAARALIETHHAALAGKIVIDPSNPIAPDGNGGFRKTISEDQSSGELIARLLPEGAEPVKAFGTLSAASLASGANRTPRRAVLFYATDFPEAGRVAARLITASGFDPLSIGGIDRSLRIEVGGDLHEYGKLGKLVMLEEAQALL